MPKPKRTSPWFKSALDLKHEERARIDKAKRVQVRWEATDEGKRQIALAEEFSAKFRGQWQALEAVAKVLKDTGKLVLVVTGGRTFCETHDVAGHEVKPLDDAMAERKALGQALDWIKPTKVIHGGAHGADRWAAIWASRRGIECVAVEAKWKELGHQAGPERNHRMVTDHGADAGCVFPGGDGTADCEARMRRAGLPVYEVAVSDVTRG